MLFTSENSPFNNKIKHLVDYNFNENVFPYSYCVAVFDIFMNMASLCIPTQYIQAKVATGFYREAEESLSTIQDETIQNSFTYLACLCRWLGKFVQGGCLIFLPWEILYGYVPTKCAGTPDSFALLQLVPNDSYGLGQFLVAAKAFHMLDRLDGGPEMWEGLRGAVRGCAQAAAARSGQLREALALLRGPGAHPRAEHIVRPIVRWAHRNRIQV